MAGRYWLALGVLHNRKLAPVADHIGLKDLIQVQRRFGQAIPGTSLYPSEHSRQGSYALWETLPLPIAAPAMRAGHRRNMVRRTVSDNTATWRSGGAGGQPKIGSATIDDFRALFDGEIARCNQT